MTALIRWHNVPCFAHPSSMGFKLFHFKKYRKSLIIVAYPTDALQFKPLFQLQLLLYPADLKMTEIVM